MKSPQLVLRENVNALMKAREWTSNKPAIEASDGRLTNGTLGRIRSPEGENVKLSVVEDLALVFGVQPFELLSTETSAAVAQPGLAASVQRIAKALAMEMPDEVREDVGYLLGALVKRKGGAPEQRVHLASLLDAVEAAQVVPAQLGGELDLDQAMSQAPAEHASAVAASGDDITEGQEEWEKRFKRGSFAPRTGGSSSTTTGKPKSKPGKEKRK